MKWKLFFSASLFFAMSNQTVAAEITCNDSGTLTGAVDSQFELNINQMKPSTNANVTIGGNFNDFVLLYEVFVSLGTTAANCDSSISLYHTILSTHGALAGTVGNNNIYPTSTEGIGISIENTYGVGQFLKLYPDASYYGAGANGISLWGKIKIWKMPGANIPYGPVSFIGPTVGQIYMKNGSTFKSNNPSRLWDGNKGWIASSRNLKGTAMFQSATCDLLMDNRTVQMGRFDGIGGKSAWKDASFNLKCPVAYGYERYIHSNNQYDPMTGVNPNGTLSLSNNSKNNGPVSIQILPRTAVVDTNNGIIALDGSGAKGYGIQLAWGDHSTLGSGAPAKPVILNSWTKASELNSAYRATAYGIGASAINAGADGTIKLAARYVRTSGPTQPGPANAIVEVLASYQ